MGKGSANECMVFPFCEGEETQSDRKVLTCSGSSCDVRVHPECYGLDEYAGKFSCDSCKYASGEKVTCVMCPSLSGAFKKTVGGKYIHVVCALWTKCEFGDIELLSGISITNVFPAASKENCTICKDRGRDVKAATGVTIPCKKSTCSAHVHVSCAQSKRLLKFAFKDDMVCLTYCARHGGNRSRSSSAQTNTHSTHSTTKGGGAQVGRSTSASANEESGKEGDRDINRQRSKQREGESSRASRAVSQTKEGEERPAATNAGSFKSKNSKSGDSAGGIKRELKGSITNTSGEREGSTREGDRDTTEQDRNSKRPRKDVKRESSVRETKGTSTSSIAISKDASGSQLRARVQSFVRSQNTEMKEFIEQAMLGTKEKFVEILPKVRQMSEDNRALQLRIKALEDEHAALTTVQQRLNERRQAKTVPPKADNMQHVNKNLITAIFIILSELNGQSMESFNAIENKDSFILKVFDQLQAQAEEGVSPTARDRLIRGVLSKCLKEFTLI